MPLAEYKKWKSNWYRTISKQKVPIQEGEALVIDAHGVGDIGFIGSNNALGWMNAGAVGVVTNAGCRDTDEIIKEGIPVYSERIARGIRPGRLEWDAEQVPVSCGGVYVHPGDVIVADGDGVIVVPLKHAETVAAIAREIANGDKAGRKAKYEAAGLDLDDTLDPL